MFRRCSSDDSELSDSVINSKSAIRVSVCLQRYFKDVRSRCYILVIRNRRVRWLEKRLKKMFSLPDNFCLCANGHLLPSTEPLALLRPEDSIEVIPLLEVSMEMVYKQNTLTLNVNNQLEKQVQNEEKISNSLHPVVHHNCGIDHFASISNHIQTISEEVNDNRTLKTSNAGADTSKFDSNDDIDGTRALNNAQDLVNTASPINNITSFTGENKRNYDTKDTMINFYQLKRRALALLDAHQSVRDVVEATEEEPPLRRVRRRVRRRARRNPQPEQETVPGSVPVREMELEPEPERQLEADLESQSSTTVDSLSGYEQPAEMEPGVTPMAETRSASPRAEPVARNDAARSRPPRVVRPLGVDN
ncbi:uncharacterized protein LOC126770141 [Nymphalis io]|uniref:uncharacterized protein LOC126770141 n=1 Tax=Inachis io TaxID=171585 RepID=UPI00216A22CD|nr:uncharacterized protein LOC126770141 [Nymphalis io]